MPRLRTTLLLLSTLSLLILPTDKAEAQVPGELVGTLILGAATTCTQQPQPSTSHERCTGGSFGDINADLVARRATPGDVVHCRVTGGAGTVGFTTRETTAAGRGRVGPDHLVLTEDEPFAPQECRVRITGTFHRVGTAVIGRIALDVHRADATFRHWYCGTFTATAVPVLGTSVTLVTAQVEARDPCRVENVGDGDGLHGRMAADDDPTGVHDYPYTPSPTTTSIPVPPTTLPTTTSITTTSIPIGGGTGYPSNDCAGMPVFDGFADGGYVKLRTGGSGGSTWVCVAVDDGTRHFGGKVRISGGTPSPPVDDDQGACDANPASRVVNGDGFVGTINHDVDVNVAPNGTDVAWVCVEVTETLTNTPIVAKRLVIATATPSGTGFDQDAATPPSPYYVEAPNPGAVSSYCQTAAGTRTRLLNADVGSGHVWLYTLSQNGNTKQHVCARGQNGSTVGGEHLTVDANGGQTFVTVENSADFGVCPIPISGLTGVYELKAGAGPPSYLCAMVLSTSHRVKVDVGGSQAVVTHVEETA